MKKNDDKDSPTSPGPVQAQSFLSKFWPSATGTNPTQEESESESDESVKTTIGGLSKASNWATTSTQMSQDHTTTGDLPIPSRRWTEPKFSIQNEGPIRQSLEVEFRTLNGKPFKGTITPKEAKHEIFKKCLGFEYSNFYGVRPAWKGFPTMTFTFCEPTNVDDLAYMQDFEYIRTNGTGVEKVEERLGCHIKGLRGRQEDGAGWEPFQENWMRVVKIEGCDYQISNNELIAWLSHYGEVLSPVVEDCFEDSDVEEGINAMGIYSVKMKLKREIPQLLPMCGKRIKVYYKGIDKLCTKCFGKHPRRICKSEKVPWIDYVAKFVDSNVDIPSQAYGRWTEILKKEKKVSAEISTDQNGIKSKVANQTERSNASSEEPPDPETAATSETAANNQGGSKEPKNKIPTESETTSTEFIQTQMPLADNPEADNYLENELDEPWPGDFNVPADDEEMEAMIEAMVAIGMQCREAELVIKARKKDYNDALKKFKADSKKRMPKKDARRGRQQKK
jgi:hypothetical protein